eukprot:IDg13037t1
MGQTESDENDELSDPDMRIAQGKISSLTATEVLNRLEVVRLYNRAAIEAVNWSEAVRGGSQCTTSCT